MTKLMNSVAIQETYGEKYQNCWGCGPKNEAGLHLHSYPSANGEKCICEFQPDKKYTGGVPENLFGGMIAMLFDCHGTASAAWFNHRSKGLELNKDTVIGRYITARLEIDFIKPLPIEEKVTIEAIPEEIGEKKIIVSMSMEAGGVLRAKARMVAVGIKENR